MIGELVLKILSAEDECKSYPNIVLAQRHLL